MQLVQINFRHYHRSLQPCRHHCAQRSLQSKTISAPHFLASTDKLRLLKGELVGIQVGGNITNVHAKLLYSVIDGLEETLPNTDALPKDLNKILELPVVARTKDNMTFQSFIAWLYSIDRSHVLKRHSAMELISLYLFSIALTCESLRTDSVQCLQAILVKVSSGMFYLQGQFLPMTMTCQRTLPLCLELYDSAVSDTCVIAGLDFSKSIPSGFRYHLRNGTRRTWQSHQPLHIARRDSRDL